jgi:hypothetical protein
VESNRYGEQTSLRVLRSRSPPCRQAEPTERLTDSNPKLLRPRAAHNTRLATRAQRSLRPRTNRGVPRVAWRRGGQGACGPRPPTTIRSRHTTTTAFFFVASPPWNALQKNRSPFWPDPASFIKRAPRTGRIITARAIGSHRSPARLSLAPVSHACGL